MQFLTVAVLAVAVPTVEVQYRCGLDCCCFDRYGSDCYGFSVGAPLAAAVSTVVILTVTVLVLELLTVAVLFVVGIVCSVCSTVFFPFHVLGLVRLAGVRVHLLFGIGLLLQLLFWALS